MEKMKMGGNAFDVWVREKEQIVYVYYDVGFEEKFSNHDKKLNALENFVTEKVDVGEREVVFRVRQ